MINIELCFTDADWNRKSDVYLMVGLPLQHTDRELAASWERGREILPGAQIAVNSINRNPDILPDHILQLIEVDIGRCDQQNHNFLIEFVNITFHHDLTSLEQLGSFVQLKCRSKSLS